MPKKNHRRRASGPGRKIPEQRRPEPSREASKPSEPSIGPVAAVRLQKALAQSGLGSRREIERWISAGEIEVNGKVAELGQKISTTDSVLVRGRRVTVQFAAPTSRVLIYHKPADEICTRSDPEGRPTVFENLPSVESGRWISVGRLDLNTAGLLLFTNDGQLASELMHPSAKLTRVYIVRVQGRVEQRMLDELRKGVELDDGPAAFDEIRPIGGSGSNSWYRVTLHEGRNRVVRRLWEAVGCRVSRLSRASFGPVQLPRELRAGQWQEMDESRIKSLLELVKKAPRSSS